MTSPRRPIEFGGTSGTIDPGHIGQRLPAPSSTPRAVLDALAAVCPTSTDADDRNEHGRDWWPLAMHWALAGSTVTRPDAVCRPHTTDDVARIVRICCEAGVAITAGGGRSGVCGGAIPLHGGVALDMTSMVGGAPSELTPGQVVQAWAAGFKPLDHVHHQIGNLRTEIHGDSARGSHSHIVLLGSHTLRAGCHGAFPVDSRAVASILFQGDRKYHRLCHSGDFCRGVSGNTVGSCCFAFAS